MCDLHILYEWETYFASDCICLHVVRCMSATCELHVECILGACQLQIIAYAKYGNDTLNVLCMSKIFDVPLLVLAYLYRFIACELQSSCV